MFCYQVSKEEAEAMWMRMVKGHTHMMNVYVPWCFKLHDMGFANDDYLLATMHHWDEYIAFLTRKKLKGEFE
jgi:hypothetical protein